MIMLQLLKANYGANLEFHFYDLEPPVKNNSFGEYKIRTVAVNGVEIVSNVNARAKCPFKGINGCKEISEATSAALVEKYGLVADEPADFQDENGNIYTVMLSLVLTVDGEFSSGYDLIENANGLFLSLGINWSEQSLMNKFGIDPDSKKNVDTNFQEFLPLKGKAQ